MYSKKIIFQDIKEINKFLQVAESVDFDIDLQYFSCVVDGKSVLGILGFGLGKVLDVRLNTDDGKKAKEFLARISFCLYNQEVSMIM